MGRRSSNFYSTNKAPRRARPMFSKNRFALLSMLAGATLGAYNKFIPASEISRAGFENPERFFEVPSGEKNVRLFMPDPSNLCIRLFTEFVLVTLGFNSEGKLGIDIGYKNSGYVSGYVIHKNQESVVLSPELRV